MYARDPAEAVEVGPAADHLPAGRQSQDRQGSRSDRPALDPRPRRRGDRVNRREFMTLLAGAATLVHSAQGATAQENAAALLSYV